ncbi:MAG: hypothetical protein Fur0037_18610 [Planctomycetota bacterium]
MTPKKKNRRSAGKVPSPRARGEAARRGAKKSARKAAKRAGPFPKKAGDSRRSARGGAGKTKTAPRQGSLPARGLDRATRGGTPAGSVLPRQWAGLCAGDVMQTDLLTVDINAPLSEVERLLSEHRIGGVPVTNEAGRVVGVISMRDLVERYTQDPDARPRRGRGFFDLPTYELDEDLVSFEVPVEAEETAGQLMTTHVVAVDRDDPLNVVAKAMVAANVHRVLVHDGPRTVGIVSTMDLLRVLAS